VFIDRNRDLIITPVLKAGRLLKYLMQLKS
jgi:hypothetical protein